MCSLAIVRSAPTGKPGLVGKNRKIAADGSVTEFGAVLQTTVGPGDRLEIETPGGGGFGTSSENTRG